MNRSQPSQSNIGTVTLAGLRSLKDRGGERERKGGGDQEEREHSMIQVQQKDVQ